MRESATVDGEAGREVAGRVQHCQVQPMQAILDRAVRSFGDKPAFRFLGRVTSYSDFNARIEEAARVLRKLGAGPGVRIGLMLPSSPAVAIYMFGAFATGATVVPLDPAAHSQDLIRAVAASGMSVLVTIDLAATLAKALTLARDGGIEAVAVVSFASMLPMAAAARMRLFSSDKLGRPPLEFACPVHFERDLLREKTAETVVTPGAAATPRPALLDDIAIIWCSLAGGVNRTALLTQANIASNLVQICEAMPALKPGQERIVAALPLWHPLAFALAVNVAVAAGAELAIVPEMTGKALAETVRGTTPTILMAPAPLISEMAADPGSGSLPFGSLQFGVVAGDGAVAGLPTAIAAITPAPLLYAYGLSMASAVIGITRADDAGLAANTRALSGTRVTVRDFADLSREVPRGERGELSVSGPQVALAHQVSPSAGAFIGPDLRTGDLGLIDADGRLFVVDRVEDLIVAAGYLIYPRRIEAALLEHPGVLDAAVIGVSDGKRGNAPKAFVIVKRGVGMTERDLRLFLASRISKIEMPADIDFCTVLPRTAFGLICKPSLREAEAARQG
ncbi:MAG: AMP-binding protein [Hyphomicrobiaceae bacterium]